MEMNYSAPPIMTAASTRLSVMMFLEYLIWGSWLPLLALYLGDVLGFTGGADRLDLRHAGDRLRRRPVLRRPDRRPPVLHREAAGACCTSSAAPRCSRWRIQNDVLAVLRRHAGLPAGLHADDVADQRDLLPPHRRRADASSASCGCGARSAGLRPAGRSCSSSPARPGPICTRRCRASSPSPASRRSRSPRSR